MITVSVPGRKPVNLIIDTAYNTVRCIHAKLVQHFVEYYAFDDVEYSCEVETVVAPIEKPPPTPLREGGTTRRAKGKACLGGLAGLADERPHRGRHSAQQRVIYSPNHGFGATTGLSWSMRMLWQSATTV